MVVLGISYMLVRLKVLVVELALVVQISERVVLQRYMGYLEKKFVWMFGGFGYLKMVLGYLGMMSVKTD